MRHPIFCGMLMSWLCLLWAACGLLLFISGCSREPQVPAVPADVAASAISTPIAGALALATTDEGRVLTAGWYLDRKRVVSPERGPNPISMEKETEFLARELTDILLLEALVEEARQSGLAEDATQAKWRDERRKALGLTVFRHQWLRDRATVSQDDLRRYYEGHKDEFFVQGSFSWKQIAVDRHKRGDQAALDRITQAYKLLEAGRSFDEVIELYSDREPKDRHAVWGPYQEGEIPNVKVEAAAKATDVGKYTQILQLPYEYQILLIEDKKPARYKPLQGEVLSTVYAAVLKQKEESARNQLIEEAVKKGHLRLSLDNAAISGLPPATELARFDDPDVQGDERLITVSDLDELAAKAKASSGHERRELLLNEVLDEVLRRRPDFMRYLESEELAYRLELEEFRLLADRMLEQRVLAATDPVITADDVAQEYNSNRERYLIREHRAVYALWCYARLQPGMYEFMKIQAFEQARARIERIRAEIADGLSFIHAVRSQSDGPRKDDGLMGIFPKGNLEPRLDNEAFRIGLGEVSQPVRTAKGYALLWVPAIKPSEQPPLEQVEAAVRNNIAVLRRDVERRRILKEIGDRIHVKVDADAAKTVVNELRLRQHWDPSGETWPILAAPGKAS